MTPPSPQPAQITTAGLPLHLQQSLVWALQAFFPQSTSHATPQPGVSPPARVEIASGLAAWTRLLQTPATADQPHPILRRFYQTLANANLTAQGRLTFTAILNDDPSPHIHCHFGLTQEPAFINQFSRFIRQAPIIQSTADRLSNHLPFDLDALTCTCPSNGPFTLQWLDPTQDRYVHQNFNPTGQPIGSVQIVFNG